MLALIANCVPNFGVTHVWLVLQYCLVGVIWGFAVEGHGAGVHRVDDAAGGPNINFQTILLPLNNLRCHVVVRAQPFSELLILIKHCREAEVSQLDVERILIVGHEYVLQLYVTVGYVFLVHVVEGVEDLLAHRPHVLLHHSTILHRFSLLHKVVKERATVNELRNDVVVLIVVEQLVDLHDAGVVQLLQYLQFVLQISLLCVVIDFTFCYEFNGAIDFGLEMVGLSDGSKASFSKYFINPIPLFNTFYLFET